MLKKKAVTNGVIIEWPCQMIIPRKYRPISSIDRLTVRGNCFIWKLIVNNQKSKIVPSLLRLMIVKDAGLINPSTFHSATVIIHHIAVVFLLEQFEIIISEFITEGNPESSYAPFAIGVLIK